MPYKKRTDNPKMGRPTLDPKGNRLNVRLSDSEVALLDRCAEYFGCKKSEAVLMGIRLLAESIER